MLIIVAEITVSFTKKIIIGYGLFTPYPRVFMALNSKMYILFE